MKTQGGGGSNVAIVHDWLVGGGAEQVVATLHEIYPDAPIYTSYATKEWQEKLDNQVITGYLQHWPFSRLRKYLSVLRLWWFRSLDLRDYDLIISSSGNGEAKHIRTPKNAKHMCYCHSPVHFYWSKYDEYMKNPGFGVFNPLVRLGLRLLVGPLKRSDYNVAQQPDVMLANSSHIRAQIKKFYHRDSTVVFPPVDIKRFTPKKEEERQGFVIVGRQVPYKRVDLAIKACNKLNLPLTVIGRGPEHHSLREIAGNSIKFISDASDHDVVAALQSSKGFIFCSEEDFGIAPVEALAAGCPVIAYAKGGALDYIQPGINGELFEKQTVSSLIEHIKIFNKRTYSQADVMETAKKFSKESFKKNVSKTAADMLN